MYFKISITEFISSIDKYCHTKEILLRIIKNFSLCTSKNFLIFFQTNILFATVQTKCEIVWKWLFFLNCVQKIVLNILITFLEEEMCTCVSCSISKRTRQTKWQQYNLPRTFSSITRNCSLKSIVFPFIFKFLCQYLNFHTIKGKMKAWFPCIKLYSL